MDGYSVKGSLKRSQQPATPSKPSSRIINTHLIYRNLLITEGGTTKLSTTPLQHRQKESRKGDKGKEEEEKDVYSLFHYRWWSIQDGPSKWEETKVILTFPIH